MLNYNTHNKKLILPEYGRTIQNMVDHCLTIENRDERNACAKAIIKAMGIILPSNEKKEERERKLWDHLAIMSDFKLDVDFPFETVKQDELSTKPDPVYYAGNEIRFRHYGKTIVDMIGLASTMEDGPDREDFTLLIANHMKKQMLSVNPDGVDDEKIFRDLAELSKGSIRLNPETVRLHEFKAAAAPVTAKKKRKKK